MIYFLFFFISHFFLGFFCDIIPLLPFLSSPPPFFSPVFIFFLIFTLFSHLLFPLLVRFRLIASSSLILSILLHFLVLHLWTSNSFFAFLSIFFLLFSFKQFFFCRKAKRHKLESIVVLVGKFHIKLTHIDIRLTEIPVDKTPLHRHKYERIVTVDENTKPNKMAQSWKGKKYLFLKLNKQIPFQI